MLYQTSEVTIMNLIWKFKGNIKNTKNIAKYLA